VRVALFIVACLAGLIIALLGNEPPLVIALIALLVYPLSVATVTRAADRARRPAPPPLLASLLTGLSGAFLVVLLARLAIDAPSWVDATNADCGGPSTGTQQIALVFASIAFIVAAIPEAVTVAAVGLRLRSSSGPPLPLSLTFFPIAVALTGTFLIIASYITTC
jgi:hypothetical protein